MDTENDYENNKIFINILDDFLDLIPHFKSNSLSSNKKNHIIINDQ